MLIGAGEAGNKGTTQLTTTHALADEVIMAALWELDKETQEKAESNISRATAKARQNMNEQAVGKNE